MKKTDYFELHRKCRDTNLLTILNFYTEVVDCENISDAIRKLIRDLLMLNEKMEEKDHE